MDEVRVGRGVIALVRGDITRFTADAIVNAANSSLAGGGGVDGAIHRAAGSALVAELRDRYRGCPTGSAVITGSGRLAEHGVRWVIHAVGPRWRGGQSGERELLASACSTSLRLAEEAGARTIAFPAISCGIYGYPVEEAARVALSTVADYLARTDEGVERATFVLFSADTLEPFEEALGEVAGAQGHQVSGE